jgi:uncharacterized protein DUF3667
VSAVCANCGESLQGPFCHACGQRVAKPIDFPLMVRMLSRETVELDGRYIRTLIDLTRRPGLAIAGYLEGHRIALFNPGKYLFVNTTIAILLFSLLGIELLPPAMREGLDPDAMKALDLSITLSAYLNFLYAFLVAIPQALLSHIGPVRRNLAESFAVQMFVQGQITIPLVIIALAMPDYAYLAGFAGLLLQLPYLAWVLVRVHCVSAGRALLQSAALFIVYLFVSVLITGFTQLIGISYFAGSSGAG